MKQEWESGNSNNNNNININNNINMNNININMNIIKMNNIETLWVSWVPEEGIETILKNAIEKHF